MSEGDIAVSVSKTGVFGYGKEKNIEIEQEKQYSQTHKTEISKAVWFKICEIHRPKEDGTASVIEIVEKDARCY